MPNHVQRTLSVLAMIAICCATNAVAERAERTVELSREIPVGGSLELSNLLGHATIRGGGEGRTATVVARIVAEAKTEEDARALVESIRVDLSGERDAFAVHVAYPVDRHTAFKYPKSERDGLMAKWVAPVIDRDSVAVEYDGRLVRVGPQRGAVPLVVHLTVTLPMDIQTSFRQIVGSVEGSTSRGELDLEVIEGEIVAHHLYGSLAARTGGGRVDVSSFHGTQLGLQTSSGSLALADVNTKRARLTTGSGQIEVSGIVVDELRVESSTGNVEIHRVEPGSINIDTGSGGIDLTPNFKRTTAASIRTGSGDVTLRVTELSSFDLLARTKSGAVRTKGVKLDPRQPVQGAIGLRCGAGGPEVHVTAKEGEVTVRGI